jgi:uncharacterized membrane protein
LTERKSYVGHLAAASSVAILLLLAGPFPAGARVDPASGRVRVLYMGDGWGPSPVPYFQTDPAFTIVSVPTSELHVGHGAMSLDLNAMKKFMRLYMPRTLQDLLDNQDLFILSDADSRLMNPAHFEWMIHTVEEQGFGLVMVGGLESFGAPRSLPWTPIEGILPVNFVPGGWVYRSFKVRPATDHAFTRSLPWHEIPLFHGTNRVSLKQAGVLLLTAAEVDQPPLSYMDVGTGRTVAHSSDWTPGAGADVMRWEYYRDYVANIAYLASGSIIPEDVRLMHLLRTSFWATRSRLRFVVDTISFVENFGASAQEIEVGMGEVRQMIKEAEGLYIGHEYEESRDLIGVIDDSIVDLHEETIKLKGRALVWIYLIEWTATTATGMLAGFLLWTLMVRRRLYREVSVTRVR